MAFGDGGIVLLQVRQGAATQDERRDVLPIDLERLICAGTCLLELPRREVHLASLQLRGIVPRQQIRSPYVFAVRSHSIPGCPEGLCKLETSLSEAGILLDGIAILNDRLVHLTLRHILVAALEVFPFGNLRILRTRRQRGC